MDCGLFGWLKASLAAAFVVNSSFFSPPLWAFYVSNVGAFEMTRVWAVLKNNWANFGVLILSFIPLFHKFTHFHEVSVTSFGEKPPRLLSHAV